MSSEIAVRDETAMVTAGGYDMIPVEQIKLQTEQVKSLMASCMSDGMHYGKIPGCGDKPTLLQPGAQKLTMMFGLADTYEISREDLPDGHREYTVKCLLVSKSSGLVQGSGVGLCSTMEKKYRYRNVSDYEVTDLPIPKDSKERKKEYRKQGFGMKKVDGVWCWVRYKDAVQQENPDIADTYNTVLKMACKRALVAAVLNTLAVSDLFTQDIEDLGSYAIDFSQKTNGPERQPHGDDPRKALWAETGTLKARMLELGGDESAVKDWMQSAIRNDDGTPKETAYYTTRDIQALCDHLRGQIRSLEQQARQDEYQGDAERHDEAAETSQHYAQSEAGLADHDIPL